MSVGLGLRAAGVAALVAVVACTHPRSYEAEQAESTTRFTSSLAASFLAHDADDIAALFSPDADLELVGDALAFHGRAGVGDAARAMFTRYTGARLSIGRVWIGNSVAVVEFVFNATSDGHPVGAVGAAVLGLDSSGLARTSRVYVDVPTLVGQVDPSRLPDGMQIRTPLTTAPGTQVTVSRHTAIEAANLAKTSQIWARLDGHDAAGTLAPSSDDYVYEDFASPASLDKLGTQHMIARFLAMCPDFVIASKPTYFAAGDDVITESIEHMSARGQSVVLHGLDVKHFSSGRVTKEWQYANGAEALRRLLGIDVEK